MKAYVYFAEGFEEVEALTPVDALTRAGVEVVRVAVGDSLTVKSSHGIPVTCDMSATEVKDKADLVFLPGGMPGSVNLAQCWDVNRVVVEHAQDRVVAAICAAPAVVLGPLGLLKSGKCACYPGCESYSPGIEFTNEGVVVDGNIVTARSVAWAWPLSFTLVEMLLGAEARAKLEKQVCWNS